MNRRIKNFLLATATLLTFSTFYGQTISRFDFNSTATIMTATTGPNGTSISPVAVSPAGVCYITSGCGAGVGMDMRVPGAVFDIYNMTIRVEFQRWGGEGTGNFFERGPFIFGFRGRRLYVQYDATDGIGTRSVTITSPNSIPSGGFNTYEFGYDNCRGVGYLMENGVPVAFDDGPDNYDLDFGGGGDALIGSEIDNACSSVPGIDWIAISGNTTTCLIPMNVEYGDFDGTVTNAGVRLDWSTITETNNSHFEVQRSIDGENFETFTQIEGANNSNSLLHYEALDQNPSMGKNYYRLMQVDNEGASGYSDIIEVVVDDVDPVVDASPNPTSGPLTISWSHAQTGAMDITIFNMAGKVVHQATIDANNPWGQHEVDLSGQASGMYIAIIKSGNFALKKKLIVASNSGI